MKSKAKKKKKDVWFLLGIVGCIGLMVFAARQIHERTKEFSASDKANSSLQSMIINNDAQPSAARASVSADTANPAYGDAPVAETDPTGFQVKTDRTRPLPVPMTQAELGLVDRVNLDQLMREYPSSVGWIYQPDTVIDYPIMQGEDNRFYLSHLYDDSANSTGSIFMDCRNEADYSDSNTILYGHHMRSGKMFASITGYKQQAYYDAHPVMYLFTGKGIFRVELVAGYVVSGKTNSIPLRYEEEGSFEAYRDGVYENSTFDSGIEFTRDDYMLAMATCTYDFANARYVLLGRIRELVDTASAIKNIGGNEE